MKTKFIHATSSPYAMPAETNDRRFAVLSDEVNATEVSERLNWQALRASISIDTSSLNFLPTGPHQVAGMANLGAELLQEVKAYRPAFQWKSSPAEIVGALIEEVGATPTAHALPVSAPEMWQLRVASIKEQFPSMTYAEAQSNALLSEVNDLRTALANAKNSQPATDNTKGNV